MLRIFFSFWNSYSECLEMIFWSSAIASLLVLLFYYLYFFMRLSFYKCKECLFDQPISIIICAKNELDNLRNNLPYILSQNYSRYEVIVVNDQSNDESSFYLDGLAKENSNLVVIDIDEFVTHGLGKKFALTLGIKTAKYEHILLTDADCIPKSRDWVKKMTSNFDNADIILGYGSYEIKKGFLNKMIRFDSFNVAQQYFSFALAGETYMGVGRNLAYLKSLFFDNKGFASHIHIPSGDDDLFIQEIAERKSVAIEISEDAHTTSEVIDNWKDWFYQKRRHLTASSLYKVKFKFLLAIYPLSQFLFILSICLLFMLEVDVFFVFILLAFRMFFSYIVNYKIMKQLNVYDLYWFHPLYEFAYLLIQVNFVLLNLFRKPQKWSR